MGRGWERGEDRLLVHVKVYPPFHTLTGTRSLEVELPEEDVTVGGVLREVCLRYPALTFHLGSLTDDQAFRRSALVLLADDVADLSWPVGPGQVVALAGPLQGG